MSSYLLRTCLKNDFTRINTCIYRAFPHCFVPSQCSEPCQNDGLCFNGRWVFTLLSFSIFRCVCPNNSIGDFCQFHIPCYDVHCQNGGVCVSGRKVLTFFHHLISFYCVHMYVFRGSKSYASSVSSFALLIYPTFSSGAFVRVVMPVISARLIFTAAITSSA